MPKRLLDDSILSSHSMARCSPRAQDAFPRFILLADDFGCFEVVPRLLCAKGWVYREDVTEIEIMSWLGEYEAQGMLFAWEDDGRLYAYLTGWHGEHGQRHRKEYSATNEKGSKRRTPRPPGFDPETSRFTPARESAGLASLKIPSPFVPGREIGGKRNFPPDPGSVVPVPVAVPAASLSAARSAAAPPKPKKLSPQAEAYEHWKAVVWPLLSPEPCPEPGDIGWTNLSRRCRERGTAGVKAAMDLAAGKLRGGDEWLRDNLTLLSFCTTQFEKYLPRAKAANGAARNNGMRPAAVNWWDDLSQEQRGQLAREKHALAPELDGAPLGMACELGQKARDDVVALLDKWRGIATRGAQGAA